MTIVTIVAAGDVVQVFTGGREAIVARATRAQNLRMVDYVCRHPDIAVVTVFAHIGGLYVRQILAGGGRSVVATDAITGNTNMVEARGPPAGRRVTVVAGVAAVYVRRVLAGRNEAVMTRAADAQNVRVIDGKDRRKHVGIVAVFADIAGLDMRRSLAGGFHAIVAVDAVARNIYMVEIRRQPAKRRMTVVAGVAAGDVVECFPGRRETVMAGAAVAHHLRMVDGVHRRKDISVVAVLADVGC